MPLRGRVGRHTKDRGRHCRNWPEDQDTVIALLNRIPVEHGGTGGKGNIGARVVSGIASDALYRAILTFEDKHFPRQRSGFVDPGGAMLKRMEELAGRTAKVQTKPADPTIVAPPMPHRTSLDRALDQLLIDAPWSSYPASQRNAFARLVGLAVVYIETLKKNGDTKLPYHVVMFGRAYITKDVLPTMARGDLEFIGEGGKSTQPPRMTESYGAPIDVTADITTTDSGALLLYDNTISYRVFPYHTGRIMHLEDMNQGHSWTKAQPLKP